MRLTLTAATMLDALESGRASPRSPGRHDSRVQDEALGATLPQPRTKIEDLDPANSLAAVRRDWIDVAALASLIERWLAFAVGRPACVDALAALLRTTPMPFQATQGFDWTVRLIGDRYAQVASRTHSLIGWLENLSATVTLSDKRRGDMQRLIDGLVSHGGRTAVRLQRFWES